MTTLPYTVNASMKRLLLAALFGLAMGAGALAFIDYRYNSRFVFSLISILLWFVAVLGPLLALVALFVMVARRGAALRMTAEHLQIRLPKVGMVSLPWKEIAKLETKEEFSTKSMAIFLHNPEKYTAGFTGIPKKSAEMNQRHLGTPFAVSAMMLNKPYDEIKTKADEFHRQFG
jgi:hypothetical protein